MTKIEDITKTDANVDGMTETQLIEWLRARGADNPAAMASQYLGKTEDEMNAIYDEMCGSMA